MSVDGVDRKWLAGFQNDAIDPKGKSRLPMNWVDRDRHRSRRRWLLYFAYENVAINRLWE
jgi:hypothetical protein